MTQNRYTVEDRPEEFRYVLLDRGEDGSLAVEAGEEWYADVDVDGALQRVLVHTGVSEEYGGQGLASVLVRAAVDDAIARGAAVVPVCEYVAAWLPKHPEYAEHVVQPTRQHRAAVRAQQRDS